MPPTGVRSFVSDFGRGLLVVEDSVQFLDEPTETFFRTHHSASEETASAALLALRDLSPSSGYAAASLPEVMWSAGHNDELLSLATSDEALPDGDNEVQRKQIEQLRVEFGLRASIALHRPASVVLLALRAGSTRAGTDRRLRVLLEHPDFAGAVLDPRVLAELLASRALPSPWPGAALGSEALMLAVERDRVASATSRVRLASQAIESWARMPSNLRDRESVTVMQVAHVVEALVFTRGSVAAADYLSKWMPSEFVMRVAYRVARDLLSRCREDHVASWFTPSRHPAVTLGLSAAYQRIGLPLSKELAEAAWASVGNARVSLLSRDFHSREPEDIAMRGAAWLAAMAARHDLDASEDIADRLSRCYPDGAPFGLGDRHGTGRMGILFVIAVRAALVGDKLDIAHFRPFETPERSDRLRSNDEELDRYLQPSVRWLASWADMAVGRSAEASADLLRANPSSRNYREPFSLATRVAREVAGQLAHASSDEDVWRAFEQFADTDSQASPQAAAVALIPPLRGDVRFTEVALNLAERARQSIETGGDLADDRADALVRIARGLWAYSEDEALAYFQSAIRVASRAGDDSLPRWDAVVALADVAKEPEHGANLELARRASRVAEALSPRLYDGLDERSFTRALDQLVGDDVLAILSQWRERRFGDLAWQLGGLADSHGMLHRQPLLALVLAPFSDRIDISAALRRLAARAPLEERVVAVARGMARRLGRRVDSDFAEAVLGPLRSEPVRGGTSRREVAAGWSSSPEEREAELQECQRVLAQLDLTTAEGMDCAAEALRRASVYDMAPLLSAVRGRSEFEWARIVTRVSECETFRAAQKSEFLNVIASWHGQTQSFVDARESAVRDYVEHYSGELLHGNNWVDFDLERAANVLGTSVREVRLKALEHLVVEEALRGAEHCYGLAAGVARSLEPAEAAVVLSAALRGFEQDLDLEPNVVMAQEQHPLSESAAVANFLWCALAEPRVEIRWLATHAVRAALELQINDLVDALCDVADRGPSPMYGDGRFPFYEMHAAEWLLLASERFVLDGGKEHPQLISLADRLSRKYPDHVAIQLHCNRIHPAEISQSRGGRGAAWPEAALRPIDLDVWKRPVPPKPFTDGAPESEFHLPSDLDEFMVGALTMSFEVSHQVVIDAVSDVILEDWGWRGSTALESDPRREAGVYADGETHSYKSEVPKGDSLDYYLVRHATLTIAGRLLRTARPYRDPDTGRLGVSDWLVDFDLARGDLRWISDFRQPPPDSLLSVLPTDERGAWASEIVEDNLLHALWPAPSWTCVDLDADAYGFDRSSDALISSALVEPRTASALLRALGTGNGSFSLPRAGDETFEVRTEPFVLEGWLESRYVARGIDLHDRLAEHLTREPPFPATFVIEALSLAPVDGGAIWVREGDGEPVVRVETWSTMTSGSNPQGTCGSRVSIRNDALDDLLSTLDMRLIVETRQRRRDRRRWRYGSNDDKEERSDGGEQFRVFSYDPDGGWRDFGGRARTRDSPGC
ncbi:ATP-binding protein [Demequina flava]|uniref:ATP-binding protein n=1 Tax=Demequina flava TaxID=1095025 RepID=UPI00128DBB5B|nr:ATP-binding protein [Demequina flava]